MNIRIFFAFPALLIATLSVSAQSSVKRSAIIIPDTTAQACCILQQLEPLLLYGTTDTGLPDKRNIVGLDVEKTKMQFPELIRRHTVWTQKGKNNVVATSREDIDFGQLIPLLVAALQQQNKELILVRETLTHLQERSDRDHKVN